MKEFLWHILYSDNRAGVTYQVVKGEAVEISEVSGCWVRWCLVFSVLIQCQEVFASQVLSHLVPNLEGLGVLVVTGEPCLGKNTEVVPQPFTENSELWKEMSTITNNYKSTPGDIRHWRNILLLQASHYTRGEMNSITGSISFIGGLSDGSSNPSVISCQRFTSLNQNHYRRPQTMRKWKVTGYSHQTTMWEEHGITLLLKKILQTCLFCFPISIYFWISIGVVVLWILRGLAPPPLQWKLFPGREILT